MKVFEHEIPLGEGPKPEDKMCLHENGLNPKGYGKEQFHLQKPLAIIVRYVCPGVYYAFDEDGKVTELSFPTILVKAQCSGCEAINLYPLFYWKSLSTSKEVSEG